MKKGYSPWAYTYFNNKVIMSRENRETGEFEMRDMNWFERLLKFLFEWNTKRKVYK